MKTDNARLFIETPDGTVIDLGQITEDVVVIGADGTERVLVKHSPELAGAE